MAVAAEGGGARGAGAPPTFKEEGQSPPINVPYDVISHITLSTLVSMLTGANNTLQLPAILCQKETLRN